MGKLTKEQWDELIPRYEAGEIASNLAREFGCTSAAITHMFNRKGIKRHDKPYVQRAATRHTLNERAFDELTPDSAYWIGFLMADGSVTEDGTITIELQVRDVEHLHKFRDFLSSNHKITFRRNNTLCRFRTYSKYMCKALSKYGIVPNKTFSAKAPDFLTHNPDFWRGAIDGDGHVALEHKPSYLYRRQNYWRKPHDVIILYLVGSENLMHQFAEYVKATVPTYKGSVRPHRSIFRVSTGSSTAKTLIDTLYTNASTVLDRKAEVARQILSS